MTLTVPHALILAWLRDHPDADAHEIAAALDEDHEHVVQLCAELARAGLIAVVRTGIA